MQPHFVCSECGFLSKLSSTCQNESCIKNGEHLSRCFCEDGKHFSVLKHHVSANEDVENPEGGNVEENEDGGNASTKTIDLDDPSLE